MALESELKRISPQSGQYLFLALTIFCPIPIFYSPLKKKTVGHKKNSSDFCSRNRICNGVFNLWMKSSFNDACRILWITSINWWVFVVGDSFGFVKSSKCGLPIAPIGILGVLLTTLRHSAKPSNCRTWEFKCIIVVAENSFHSLRLKPFDFLFPIARWVIGRNKPCLCSVAPKHWWWPGITACKTMLRAVQNSWKISH